MQANTNCYWKQQPLQQTIIVPTHTILHLRFDVIKIRYVQDIPKNICSKIKARKAIQSYPIIITDDDYDYILDEIERFEKIELEWNMGANSDEEYY